MNHRLLLSTIPVLAAALAGCPPKDEERLTYGEALAALEESSLDAQASGVTSSAIEISTHFTIGQAVEAAADELRAYVASQLPCAEITLSKATLQVEYGARPGNCVYEGQTLTGTTTVTIGRNDDGEVVVEHTWTKLSNGRFEVTGDATVTWSAADRTRRVAHRAEWTRLSDGRTGTGSGDRTQSTLAGGLVEGLRVDGSRSWTGRSGRWDLSIEGVEVRWIDPVPQAGRYVLVTPEDKALALAFDRRDANTITVTVSGARREFRFDVTALGIADAD
ncbi:MAG: hypothetical protein IT376_19675 [Polyangiaceae bacterium]|nr:hypothetical protein [Polyangiaceae bacterium]